MTVSVHIHNDNNKGSDNDVPSPEDASSASTDESSNEDTLPLLQYTRVWNANSGLPRQAQHGTLLSRRTCQAMGKLGIDEYAKNRGGSTTTATPTTTSNPPHAVTNNHTTTQDNQQQQQQYYDDDENLHFNRLQRQSSTVMDSTWFQKHTIPITAYGFQDGTIRLVDAASGSCLLCMDEDANTQQHNTMEPLRVREGRTHYPIVDISWDATATYLCAVDQKAMCTVWECQYQIRLVTPIVPAPTGNAPLHWWEFWQTSNQRNQQTSYQPQQQQPVQPLPQLLVQTTTPQQLSYPSSFGTPTCIVIDPAYKRNREKCILVGFQDGKLVRSKRGYIFQRRVDDVIYQGGTGRIHTITWRGNLVAWADDSGIRLLETNTWTRLAHVDRPAGARPQLYPSLLRTGDHGGFILPPSMVFDTSKSLLVAWGDCLLALDVVEQEVAPTSDAPSRRRRHVECRMAWELDCVACGVTAFDAQHVAVLGLVLDENDDEDNNNQAGSSSNNNGPSHDVELQLVRRLDGEVVYSDIIPLFQQQEEKSSIVDFAMSCSFAVPYMEDALELSVLSEEDTFEPIEPDVGLITQRTFQDSHLKWSISDAVFTDIDAETNGGDVALDEMGDDDSEDSDDYAFVTRPFSVNACEDMLSTLSIPPIINISSARDTVVARLRDIDDVLAAALARGKAATALMFALRYMRRLRRNKLDDLVNEYFRKLLELRSPEDTEEGSQLSLRRVKIAATAMPILIGGNVQLWKKWVAEFEKIPGALFVVHESLPVRDPILPKEVYSRVLVGMINQINELRENDTGSSSQRLLMEAENRFLDSLVLWGSVDTLKEFIQLYTYQTSLDISYQRTLTAIQLGLDYRTKQSAERYLRFAHVSKDGEDEVPISMRLSTSILFDTELLEELLRNSCGGDGAKSSRVVLDARARLNIMQQRFDDALQEFLCIGCSDFGASIDELKKLALDSVCSGSIVSSKVSPYTYVVTFIENHHLHQLLLDQSFLKSSPGAEPHTTAMVALMRLIGIDAAARFLFPRCSVATGPSTVATDERLTLLPIDQIVDIFKPYDEILYWFLDGLFRIRPELFVKFPSTSVPPSNILELHHKAIELYMRYPKSSTDISSDISALETYNVAEYETPFLRFIKAILPLGGISRDEIKSVLEMASHERKEPYLFSLERAFLAETEEDDSESIAMDILDLYLKGTGSVVLAAAYADRAKHHSVNLWQKLIDFCLLEQPWSGECSRGALFGTLLEAAALSGADLARIVYQIPPGMTIEGLRPRLVAAVNDYKMKLRAVEATQEIGNLEKIQLLRELGHRSRRASRYISSSDPTNDVENEEEKFQFSSPIAEKPWRRLRTIQRPTRHRLSTVVPIR